jgi:hypothetical protein
MLLDKEQQHINNLITDYVLEILPRAEYEAAARHIATCESCRKAVMRERQIGMAVKQTLSKAIDIEETTLTRIMPAVSRHNGFQRMLNQGQRQIVLVCCLLILGFATIGIQLRLQQDRWLATAPAILSTTVMITETPTATLLATSEGSKPSGFISPTPATGKTVPLPEAALAPPDADAEQLSSLSSQ